MDKPEKITTRSSKPKIGFKGFKDERAKQSEGTSTKMYEEEAEQEITIPIGEEGEIQEREVITKEIAAEPHLTTPTGSDKMMETLLKAIEESRKATIEESRKATAEESRKAADESRKSMEEEIRKAAEELRKSMEEEIRKAAEESRKSMEEMKRKLEVSGEEMKKTSETMTKLEERFEKNFKEFKEENLRMIQERLENFREDVRMETNKKLKENQENNEQRLEEIGRAVTQIDNLREENYQTTIHKIKLIEMEESRIHHEHEQKIEDTKKAAQEAIARSIDKRTGKKENTTRLDLRQQTTGRDNESKDRLHQRRIKNNKTKISEFERRIQTELRFLVEEVLIDVDVHADLTEEKFLRCWMNMEDESGTLYEEEIFQLQFKAIKVMIRVDEDDPVGEVELSFPHRNVQIRRGIDPKEHYELVSEIGRGKFGTVFKCKEKSNGLYLAAKFIAASKKEDRRNVEREVDIMRSLQHPRLLQIYDAFENGKMMCVILELIEGGELFERVIDDDFILTEKSCTVFMRQICEGIDFIHKQRILHLDMKPENILCLTKTGNRIKIIDFGLARKYDPDKKLQVLFGTPEFVAPEVVNFEQIGYGTDMWSVGVICYVLLSGLSPFMGHTDVETMANVTIGKYDFDDDAFREISSNAKDFIAKLLIKDMSMRLSAEDCLNHNWLQRKTATTDAANMEVTKDNLRQFVERWNEHPNSPYVFESLSHIIAPCSGRLRLSESLHSLEGMSPSPCGSLASSVGSDDAFPLNNSIDDNDTLLIPQQDHLRRASDSTCVLKGTDITERLNLADEIRKLTDKLFQLSAISESTTSNSTSSSNLTIKRESDIKASSFSNHSTIPRSPAITISKPQNGVIPRDIRRDSTIETPWRRQKFRITASSRDVPLAPKMNTFSKFHSELSSINSPMNYKTRSLTSSTTLNSSRNIESTVNGTKDMLLRLLEQWDGPHVPRPNQRHGSISTEWSESDTLGQRTISSLNMFFQSRSTTKKSHPFITQHKFK